MPDTEHVVPTLKNFSWSGDHESFYPDKKRKIMGNQAGTNWNVSTNYVGGPAYTGQQQNISLMSISNYDVSFHFEFF